MAETLFPDLLLDSENNNIVNVIGDKVYDNTGLAADNILQYNGTNWTTVAPIDLGLIPGVWGADDNGAVSQGSKAYHRSDNFVGPAQNASSTTIAIITSLPNTPNVSGYYLEIDVTGTVDKVGGGGGKVFAKFHVIQDSGEIAPSEFLGYRFNSNPADLNFPTILFIAGTAETNTDQVRVNYDGTGVTGGSLVTTWNVRFTYVQHRANTSIAQFS